MRHLRYGSALAFAVIALACDSGEIEVDAGLDAAMDAGAARCGSAVDCDDGVFCNGVEECDPESAAADARGCVVVPACADGEICDEESARCGPAGCETPDADGDGQASVECGGADCDDADASRYTGNIEVCDTASHDEDCDPSTYGYRDADSDGYGDARCCNGEGAARVCGDDCNDMAATVHPGEADRCDARDNDCDDAVDEDGSVLYLDCDGDGFGDTSVSRVGCPEAVVPGDDCPAPIPSSTWTSTPGDCDDSRAATHPGATDACNGIDDDCMLPVDPSTCACTDGDTTECGYDSACAVVMGTCIGGAFNCPPGLRTGAEAEVCDGIDNNCDGTVDETCPCMPVGATRSCADTGRVGACAVGTERCGPTGWTGCAEPATETCVSSATGDEDCDGRIDESLHVWTRSMAITAPAGCELGLHQSHVCARSISGECRSAAPPGARCAATGGFGHVEVAAGIIDVACLADVTPAAFVPGSTLRAYHSSCTTADDRYVNCKSAISRYCRALGDAGGFGYADGADSFTVYCLPDTRAVFAAATWADLATHQPLCSSSPPSPVYCPNAVHRWCRSRGFAAGFGTVEHGPTEAMFLCVRDY